MTSNQVVPRGLCRSSALSGTEDTRGTEAKRSIEDKRGTDDKREDKIDAEMHILCSYVFIPK